MPVSRPILIALIAAVVAAVGFYATQGGRDATDDSASQVVAPVVPPPATKDSKTQAKADQSEPADADKGDGDKTAKDGGVPAPVQRALDARKQVILFFFEPGSADDRATARGVAALRSQRGVAVFTDPIGRLTRYSGVIGPLGISQAPAVVIVGKDRKARVIEGYVDPATLAQDVADAR